MPVPMPSWLAGVANLTSLGVRYVYCSSEKGCIFEKSGKESLPL